MANIVNNCKNISIVRGNDTVLKLWLYTRELQNNATVRVPFNFDDGDKVEVRLCRQFKTEKLQSERDGTEDNCLIVLLPWTVAAKCYGLEVSVQRDGKHLRSFDCGRINIVECNHEAHPTLERVNTAWQAGMEVDMQITFSAVTHAENDYELWRKLPGNEDKTLQDFIDEVLNSKVEKEPGKGLSTNDYTNEEKTKLANAITEEQDPTVPQWAKQSTKPSYTPQEVGALPANTPLFDGNYNSLTNKPDLSGYITISVNNLVNYYLKSETYTKQEVQALIAAIQQFHYEIYASISAVASPAGNVLYLIGPTGTGSDKYEEYVYDSTKQDPWVKIGDTSIDLSGYYTSQQTDAAITAALNAALADYTTTTNLTTLLSGKEDASNKVTSISAQSTDAQYPSAKCVYDVVGNIGTILDNINGEVI